MLQGVLSAFNGHINVMALLECIKQEDMGLLLWDGAYEQFEAYEQKKDKGDLAAAFILIVAGAAQMKQNLPICEALDPKTWDYSGFQKASQISFEDVIKNEGPIARDTLNAVNAYKSGDYKGYGQQLGQILKYATGVKAQFPTQPEKTETSKREMAAKVAQGLLSSTQVGSINIQDLLICIYEADQSAEILYEGVEILEKAYKDHSIKEAIPGAIAALAFVQQL